MGFIEAPTSLCCCEDWLLLISESDKQTGIFMPAGQYIVFPTEKSTWQTKLR